MSSVKSILFTSMKGNCKINAVIINFSVRESRKILSKQSGVVRTNCLDCLDRTNVFQSKVCLRVFEELLKQQFLADKTLSTIFTNMWAMCGDFISKIYAGTHSVLT